MASSPTHRTLVVMRHAKSSWKTDAQDAERPLSGRGTRDAVAAGELLARVAPDVVWCSAALRARQTWEAAQLGGAACRDVRVEEGLYGASATELLDAVRATPASASTALLIGHEPAVTDLVVLLAVSSPLVDRVEIKFPTSALVTLTFDGDWDELTPASASLTGFEIPRG